MKRLLLLALVFVVTAALLLLGAAFSLRAEPADAAETAAEPQRAAASAPVSVPTDGDEPAPTAAPTGETPVWIDDPAERRLAAMTTEEKALQMILYCCHKPDEAEEAAAEGVGGLCLFANSFSGKTRDEVVAMTAAMQAAAPLPLLLAVDEEGGEVCRVSYNPALRARPFEAPRTLFRTGGWKKITSDTVEKAQLLLDLGLNVNLGPVCDVPSSSLNYIYTRTFSGNAPEVARYVELVVRAMKEQGLGSTLKHFPGYGGSADTHKGMAYDKRSRDAFDGSDLLPFEAGIREGADAVMVSHNIVLCMDGDLPASLSPEVHRVLREELGFEGVVVTDDLSMGAIEQFTGGQNAAVQAVLAGNDLICCGDYRGAASAIVEAVRGGTLDEAQLDASVLRILRWKMALGLDISA